MSLVNDTSRVNISAYIMDPTNRVVGIRKNGRFDVLEYQDGTKWVFLSNQEKDRFCGFLYLQHCMKDSKLEVLVPAKNKMAIYNGEIIYLSNYCGEKKPNLFKHILGEQGEKIANEFKILKEEIGFTDTIGAVNLREVGGKIYVFDTEKYSFSKKVHKK